MKFFRNIILMLALAFCAMPAFAQTTTDTNAELAAMTDAQKAQAVALLKANTPVPTSRAENVREWVDIGSSLGESLAATAGKLGVEVNKFSATPVGKLAMVLIVWNFMGVAIVNILVHLGAAAFCLILLVGWWKMFKSMFGTFDEKGKLVKLSYNREGDGPAFFVTAFGVVIGAAGFLSVITI